MRPLVNGFIFKLVASLNLEQRKRPPASRLKRGTDGLLFSYAVLPRDNTGPQAYALRGSAEVCSIAGLRSELLCAVLAVTAQRLLIPD